MKQFCFIACVFGILFLFGCAIYHPSIDYSAFDESAQVLPLGKKYMGNSVELTIDSRAPWQNSRVFLGKNRQVQIFANGSWNAGGYGWCGPEGHISIVGGKMAHGQPLYEDPRFPFMGLLGRIGKGKPFYIGKETEVKAIKSGYLYLACNDPHTGLFNNSGSVNVIIVYKKKTDSLVTSVDNSGDDLRREEVIDDKNVLHKNWAVIIGISKYKYAGQHGLTNLIFADEDAKAFARVLRNLGWSESHIKLLVNEDATEKSIRIALESWLTKAGPNDQIVLFWAGHGFADPEDPEKVYFACYDTDISIPATGYRMDKVRMALEEKKCRNVVLLADTCHAGKLITRGQDELPMARRIKRIRSEQKTPKGWIFMVAADTDRQAIEHSSWTNGAFTHSLIKGLSGKADGYESAGPKDNVVTMGELKAYLNSAMPDETQKVLGVAKRPVITTSSGDPDIWNLNLQAR